MVLKLKLITALVHQVEEARCCRRGGRARRRRRLDRVAEQEPEEEAREEAEGRQRRGRRTRCRCCPGTEEEGGGAEEGGRRVEEGAPGLRGTNCLAWPIQLTQSPRTQTQVIAGGLEITDVKVGEGAAAKTGSKVGMRYIGKLENGKVRS